MRILVILILFKDEIYKCGKIDTIRYNRFQNDLLAFIFSAPYHPLIIHPTYYVNALIC